MASKFDNGTNEFENEYFDQDEDDLGDFIVYSDEEDDKLSKHKHQRQEELEDDMEVELEEEVEKVEEEDVDEVEEVEEKEEEEEEEAPVGQQVILSLREQLKEKIRRKNAAMAAGSCKASCSSSVNQTFIPPAKDRYGTFFGPSKPVLARRVIEEGCSSIMKELQNVPSKKGTQLVSAKAQQSAVENMQKPKSISEEKRKVDALRANRDYSSLFSDDADTPQPTKEQPDKPTLVPKSESCAHELGLVDSAGTRKASAAQSARLSSKYNGLKVDTAAALHAGDQSKAGSLGTNSLACRKRMIAAAGRNGSNLKTPALQPSSMSQKMQPSVQSKRPHASVCSQRQQPETQGQRMQKQMQSHRPQGNGRPQSLQGRRPDPSVQHQQIGQNGRLKSEQKQLGPSSKSKSPHSMEKRAVKRKADDDGGRKFSSLMKELFNYDHKKYIGRDEDDRNMETDFASLEKEERRSAALARKEDEEQDRLIQEEERRERAMKKKRAAQKQ